MSDKNNKTIAELMAEFDGVVEWFESDDFSLEASLDKFAEAEKLASEIEARLSEFKNKVNELKHRS